MRNLLIVIVLILWGLLGFKMCSDWSACCGDSGVEKAAAETMAVPAAEENTDVSCPDVPICFLANSASPSFGKGYAAYIDSTLSGLGSDQKLRIIGLYNASEENTSGFDNLGLARADALRKAIGARLDDDKVELGSQQMVGQSGIEEGYSADLIRFETAEEAEAAPLPSGTLIYFPFASTQQIQDPAVEAYLNQLAEQMKTTTIRIRLTGHTDDIGEAGANMVLGRQRAQVIKEYLVNRGVPGGRITVESRGETQPVATNQTDRGRAQNRRTELQIIQ